MLKPLACGNSLVENSKKIAGTVWPPSIEMVPKYKCNLLKWSAAVVCPGQAKVQLIPVGQEYSQRNIDFVNGKAGSSALLCVQNTFANRKAKISIRRDAAGNVEHRPIEVAQGILEGDSRISNSSRDALRIDFAQPDCDVPLFGTNRSMKLYPGASNPGKTSAMINVVVAFLALFSANVFLAHAIEAYNTSKKNATVARKSGQISSIGFPAEGWSRDVTVDIADEVRRRLVEYGEISECAIDFVEANRR